MNRTAPIAALNFGAAPEQTGVRKCGGRTTGSVRRPGSLRLLAVEFEQGGRFPVEATQSRLAHEVGYRIAAHLKGLYIKHGSSKTCAEMGDAFGTRATHRNNYQ